MEEKTKSFERVIEKTCEQVYLQGFKEGGQTVTKTIRDIIKKEGSTLECLKKIKEYCKGK